MFTWQDTSIAAFDEILSFINMYSTYLRNCLAYNYALNLF